MFQLCDTTQVSLDLDFGVKSATVQVYGSSHNSQSDRWVKQSNILCGLSRHVFLPWVKHSSQSEFGKAPQYQSTEAIQILLFTSI